jgi:enamine deaminase RidA (YjgF/YER057c/UK114 family)
MTLRFLQPPGWPAPSGYANGIAATGVSVFVGGQIGWNAEGQFAEGLAAQVGQALANIAAVLAEAGGAPTDIVRLTWFVCDIEQYNAQLPAIGQAYRAVMGKHFPAMSVVGVTRLVEAKALVEIEATAVVSPAPAEGDT